MHLTTNKLPGGNLTSDISFYEALFHVDSTDV